MQDNFFIWTPQSLFFNHYLWSIFITNNFLILHKYCQMDKIQQECSHLLLLWLLWRYLCWFELKKILAATGFEPLTFQYNIWRIRPQNPGDQLIGKTFSRGWWISTLDGWLGVQAVLRTADLGHTLLYTSNLTSFCTKCSLSKWIDRGVTNFCKAGNKETR